MGRNKKAFLKNLKVKGFTLIEILVVLAIVAILSTILSLSLRSFVERARDTRRIAEIRLIAQVLEIYYQEKDTYPLEAQVYDTSQGCGIVLPSENDWCQSTDLKVLVDSRLLPKLPKDPLNWNPYYYYFEPYFNEGDSGFGTEDCNKSSCSWRVCANQLERKGLSYCIYSSVTSEGTTRSLEPALLPYTLLVTKNIAFGGTVSSSPSGINCQASCEIQQATFSGGTSVTLSALPASGYIFAIWSGDCSGSSPSCTLTMDRNKQVTANFKVFLPNWGCRKPITVSNQGQALTDYQVLVTLDTQNLISQGKMRNDCSDLRFTDSDGSTQLSYWLESGCNSQNTRIWVKVPSIPASSSKTIYLYYGNPSATSLSSLWYNVKHLSLTSGVFNYNASLGSKGYHSREMQHRLGVDAGAYHICVLKSNGNVDCYGSVNDDYLGGDAIAVSAGYNHTCVLKPDGNVDCYGQNNFGQANDYLGGDAIAVSAGWEHTCILKSNGNVDCYGRNDHNQSDDYLGGDAIAVSAIYDYNCVLKSNGNVDCYGGEAFGNPGDYLGGDAIGVAAGVSYACILKSSGNVDCYGANNYGEANDYHGGDAIGVAAKIFHTCILKSNGNVDCYGNNEYGQSNDYLGGDAIGVSVGYHHTCVLKSNGNVDCYGITNAGEANDYLGGDAKNPFRKYIFPEPIVSIGEEECL